MPRLIDFEPRWIDLAPRRGLGFLFRCTTGHCKFLNATLFANPLDGGAPFPGDSWALLDELEKHGLVETGPDGLNRLIRSCGMTRWQRTGETFETLSCTPSINAWECGHFTVTNGSW